MFMSDARKPSILTLLAALAIIIGAYSCIRGLLLFYNSIVQLSSGFGGIFELIVGLLSAAVGALALAGGIKVVRDKPGCIDLMKKYAIAISAYQIVWIIFAFVSGRIVGWGSVILDILAGAGTFVYITTNDEVKDYSVSCGNSTG
jgi:hypothetical protein